MENSSKQSKMSHNLVRWNCANPLRSGEVSTRGEMVSGTSPVVTGPECTDADCRWARDGGSVLGLQKCAFFNVTPTFPNQFASNHTESALWSYREQQWSVSRTFSVIRGWIQSRVLPPLARAHTQTHAHTHVRRRDGDRKEFNYSGFLTTL